MGIYVIKSFKGGLSDYNDKGTVGSYKFGYNLDPRKKADTLSAGQALIDEGILASSSPSASVSPSASTSPSASPSPTASPSASPSPSSSPSSSASPSTGASPSPSLSPSASVSPSASTSPSHSPSRSPSPSSGLDTVFDDLILWFVEADDGYVYGFGDTGSIYRRNSDGFWSRVYKDPNGKIKGAMQWYTSDGRVWLYWATDTLEFRKNINGDPNWNDVETVGNLVSSDWHTHQLVGGALVIANSRLVAYVGYDGSFSPEATDLIPGNLAKTIVERNGRAIIGTVRSSDTSKGVNGAIDSEVPLSQVGDDGEVFFSNMADSLPVVRFPGGGKVNPGGVTNLLKEINFFEWEEGASSWIDKQSVGNLALFGVFNADTDRNGIYSYGRKFKNAPFILNLEYKLEVDEIGAIVSTGGLVLASYKDGTDFGVKATDPNNKATAVYEGLEFPSPTKIPHDITTYSMVLITFDPLPNGSSIEFWYKMNALGEFIQAETAENQTQFGDAGKTWAVFLIADSGDIYEPRVVLNPIGNESPNIRTIETLFE